MWPFKKKYNGKPKSDFSLLWSMYNAKFDIDSMNNYLWENGQCSDLLLTASNKIKKRFGRRSHYENGMIWKILEDYCNGDLVRKEKLNEPA